ncbi:ABC transporter substrate-binding protein [Chengkuizengella sediminis]|uniref:ABC transporter substrate-binding protein n=1 Tax=Chengkuizengella sediminis TaxID=1885917 RepID=UPI001389C5CA|nr:ABC transporter substrate-binding protein [Chengkuizengella sediminis]NDI35360.1 ABC transporter substrate-binding protein [Chengkuizengella sediminis]
MIIFSLFFLTILTACSKEDKEVTTLRVGEVTRSIFYAPQYVALSQGFFEEEGLEVELATTWGGDKTMTTLLAGGIDIALVGSETSIYVYQQGADDPVINFAQLTQTDGSFLVSRKEITSFDWELLKGNTFLGQRIGGMPQMAGEFTLKKQGIDPHNDMELIQNIEFANIASAFASGTGDFVQLFEPTATVFEQEGIGYVVASFGIESGHLPYTVYMSKNSFIKNNKDAIQKYTNAIHRAQKWVENSSIEQIRTAISPYFEDIDEEIIELVIDRYRVQGSYATDPIVDEDEWNNLLDVMIEAGELEDRASHQILVNNSFAKNAIDNQE